MLLFHSRGAEASMESIEIAFSFFVERFHETRVTIIARILMQAIVNTADDTLGITSNSTITITITITMTTTVTVTITTTIVLVFPHHCMP